MPRRPRCRRIDKYPDYWNFSADDRESEKPCDRITLSLDEFETIRLLDKESLTQEQCAERMGVARTTVTAIYNSARQKIACALVDGKPLTISGGNYRLPENGTIALPTKGEHTMRIAVTYENGQIFQHFGHTAQFKIYEIENGAIASAKVVDTNGQGHGALAGFLKQCEVDTLICGGIGGGAQTALAEAGITLYGGVQGDAEEAVQALLAGNLVYDPAAKCDHHGHGEGEGHHCGGHGHGEGHHCDGHGHGEGHHCGGHGHGEGHHCH